jgi:hypothetical protein
MTTDEVTRVDSALAVMRAKEYLRIQQAVLNMTIQQALLSTEPQPATDVAAIMSRLASALVGLSMARAQAKAREL